MLLQEPYQQVTQTLDHFKHCSLLHCWPVGVFNDILAALFLFTGRGHLQHLDEVWTLIYFNGLFDVVVSILGNIKGLWP